MKVEALDLEGPLVITPKVHRDGRGFFVETLRTSELEDAGVLVEFVQENQSRSGRGTIRGLHFQAPPGQAKLIRVSRGEIFDVVVDLRRRSPSFGRHAAVTLDDRDHRQLYIPTGFAHGFCVVTDEADVVYRVSAYYDADLERGLAWDDPDIGIMWPTESPVLSPRDRQNPSFAELTRTGGGFD